MKKTNCCDKKKKKRTIIDVYESELNRLLIFIGCGKRT